MEFLDFYLLLIKYFLFGVAAAGFRLLLGWVWAVNLSSADNECLIHISLHCCPIMLLFYYRYLIIVISSILYSLNSGSHLVYL